MVYGGRLTDGFLDDLLARLLLLLPLPRFEDARERRQLALLAALHHFRLLLLCLLWSGRVRVTAVHYATIDALRRIHGD